MVENPRTQDGSLQNFHLQKLLRELCKGLCTLIAGGNGQFSAHSHNISHILAHGNKRNSKDGEKKLDDQRHGKSLVRAFVIS